MIIEYVVPVGIDIDLLLLCRVARAGQSEATARAVRRGALVLEAVHGVAPRVPGRERYGGLEQVMFLSLQSLYMLYLF